MLINGFYDYYKYIHGGIIIVVINSNNNNNFVNVVNNVIVVGVTVHGSLWFMVNYGQFVCYRIKLNKIHHTLPSPAPSSPSPSRFRIVGATMQDTIMITITITITIIIIITKTIITITIQLVGVTMQNWDFYSRRHAADSASAAFIHYSSSPFSVLVAVYCIITQSLVLCVIAVLCPQYTVCTLYIVQVCLMMWNTSEDENLSSGLVEIWHCRVCTALQARCQIVKMQ